MEGVVMASRLPDPAFWSGKSVFITGHTGFKGGWLCHWLSMMGASVHGFALDPDTSPSMFFVADVTSTLSTDARGDVADLTMLIREMTSAEPDVVIHLAAQPLVRRGYANPTETWQTNVIGTVNVLEAVRSISKVKSVIIVTTDKVYRNQEWVFPYREVDRLGGLDPYSASKSAAELVAASYRHAFFSNESSGVPSVVTARAGNVIGGGDWSEDRLIPDVLRAVDDNSPICLRRPEATRPWQHVLEPLAGYLLLAESLQEIDGRLMPGEWNFGPDPESEVTVLDVATAVVEHMGLGARSIECTQDRELEAQRLSLDSSRARALLGWWPRWSLGDTLKNTTAWHTAWRAGKDMKTLTVDQVLQYLDNDLNHE